MKNFTEEQIKDYAEEHARDVLGEQQYEDNTNAAISIISDFTSGFKKALELINQ